MNAKEIYEGQCIEITELNQVEPYYNQFRSSRSMTFEEFKQREKNRTLPFYIERASSVFGTSLGMISKPYGTWTNRPLEIIKP